MEKIMKNLTQKLRSTGICLITVAAIALPQAGHAGWFDGIPTPVEKVVKKAKSASGNIKNIVTDVSRKLNDIHEKLDASRPLANALKNGQMIKQLTEVVEYLNESQSEYQDFVDNGVDFMRQDIHSLVVSVQDINNSLNLDGKIGNRLQKAADLIEKMPPPFLYPLAIAGIDDMLQDIAERMVQLAGDLELIATLPIEQDAFLYPESYKADLCPLVKDPQKKIQLAVLGARMDNNIWLIDTMSSLMPEDLTVEVTVLGGGGATISKFPPQYLFKAMKFVLETIKLRISNYTAIASSMC